MVFILYCYFLLLAVAKQGNWADYTKESMKTAIDPKIQIIKYQNTFQQQISKQKGKLSKDEIHVIRV